MLYINKVMSVNPKKAVIWDLNITVTCKPNCMPCKIKVVQIKIKTNLQFWSEESCYTGYLA